MLLEYIKGVDLSVILNNIGILNAKDSAFYMGSLIIVLQYLHERDILYRDLKPENIMIEEDGFIKLIDFNSSKVTPSRTYTIVGSPFYTAPEVIAGKGYGKPADIWSLGVLLYELLLGKVPFGSDEEDPYKIYKEIIEKDLSFDDSQTINGACISLISKLLSKYPDKRHRKVLEKLKLHEFFFSFDWESLYTKKYTPPFKIDTGADDDIHNTENENKSWNEIMDTDSQDSSESLNEITGSDIEEYKNIIKHNWDEYF